MQVRISTQRVLSSSNHVAISSGMQPITSVTPATIRAEIEVNTIGPLVLFQAFASLLDASDKAQFISISSVLGQIEESLPYPYNSYGLTKAALNFVAKKIDQEVPGVTS
jgi:NAD(P)-dependent dehydrogenase (short-subunit alcohol dehydrogenase family)